MARIETDPNYTSPTFSRATAATDLFKKEDVQALAAAVSTHTHGPGSGLPVAAIADGTIVTADLAANAVTQVAYAVGGTSDPTTTSGSYVDLPEMSVTLTTTGGRVVAWLSSTFSPTVGTGNLVALGISLDGAATLGDQQAIPAALNYRESITCVADWGAIAAGSHTIKGRWSVSGGTFQANGTNRHLLVIELKR